ncbi:hypothetical protein [Jiella mangrovi]|uniref:Uncharacterized protein n=1 Tax=Jiella mangrovi TaxID=2821407 RepID=A0ABS4BGW1_9HYPH|nr:hypothetical protein [Jiella mangrovi]MBP0615990.1 hypothetical protein [Jiella mangrovi]
MGKIDRTVEHYPASRLPADLRGNTKPDALVTVTLVEEPVDAEPAEALPKYLRYWGIAAHKDTGVAEAVTRIRKLRDEWDL